MIPARDMLWVPGGTFRMGSDRFYFDERPQHEREVVGFWLDCTPVTNQQFAEFVDATGYRTVAEQAIDPADFPGADPRELVPGSMVFTPTRGPVPLDNWRNWWRWQPGACWKHPKGPDSDVSNIQDHPVVHVAYADARAYAEWAGCRLPSEAEFEYAAAAGSTTDFAWGNEPFPPDGPMANTWLGDFPYRNLGVGGTSPVGGYPANALGFSDLIGNVWEWTSTPYSLWHGAQDAAPGGRTLLAQQGDVGETRRVLKGGSFLCSPEYCLRFRPPARSPQSEDTGMSHIGFRCARDAESDSGPESGHKFSPAEAR